jgi:hypothetical protein
VERGVALAGASEEEVWRHLGDPLNRGGVATGSGSVQHRAVAIRDHHEEHAVRVHEPFDEIERAAIASLVECSLACAVLCGDGAAHFHQPLGQFRVPTHSGIVQRRVTRRVDG